MSATAPAHGAHDRLTPLDATFLYMERPTEPLHVGSVAVLEETVPFARLVEILGTRLGGLRRYRQRPIRPLLDLRPPSWEDDPSYDPRHHIRRVSVPAPAGEQEFHRLVDDLFAVPCDPRRPLWETYLIEGLSGGRAAILSKVHHCMIDGISGAKVLEVMTDATAVAAEPAASDRPTPDAPDAENRSLAQVGRDALFGMLGAVPSPARALAGVRDAAHAAGVLAGLVSAPLQALPFNGPLTGTRRIVWVSFALDDFLAMRGVARCKVNDVVLAVIAGALRRYLAAHAPGALAGRVRALVPVSVRRAEEELALGNRVSAMFATLPVDVADPLERLRMIIAEMRALKEDGQSQAFEFVLSLAGTLPTPVSQLITRLPAVRQVVHTVCTNVPGPRETRYVLGRRVLEIHPIVPIAVGIGLAFAILSYDGRLSICATADPSLVPDASELPAALNEAANELGARLGAPAPRAADRRPAAGDGRAAPRVADLMTREVTTIEAHDPLAQAWETMRQRRIRHLPVVERDGRVIGMVTHRDLLGAAQSSLAFRREDERVRLLGRACAADVMETHLSVADPEEPAADAGLRMVRHKIGCLPVVGADGRLAGIVTDEDFLRWATERMALSVA